MLLYKNLLPLTWYSYHHKQDTFSSLPEKSRGSAGGIFAKVVFGIVHYCPDHHLHHPYCPYCCRINEVGEGGESGEGGEVVRVARW